LSLKNLKYPLYLFLLILFAKVGYVIVESFYNFHVLSITTSAELSREIIEELNINGHKISAIGITLLLLPFLYLLVKRLDRVKMIALLSMLTFSTYFVAYESLNILIEKIVQTNKEKRHDAYYVNIFKYGILNNIFAYDSFIENKKIQNNTLDVNDRILLTNSFLLLHADKDLIDKLKQRGKERVADLYIQIELQDDYNTQFTNFKKASDEIGTLWNSFNNNRKNINEKLKQLHDEETIKNNYKEFTDSLKNSYTQYQNGWNQINLTIREETKIYKIQKIQTELTKYFRYQSYKKAQLQYKESMYKNFGHYIEPKRWKDKNNNLTFDSIKNVITQEVISKAKDKMNNLPKGLSVKDFMYHDNTKVVVNKEFKEKDILIPYDFDYSYNQFKKYFQVMSSKKQNNAFDTFYKNLENKIGKNDLKLSMNYKEFIYSEFIKNKISSKIGSNNIDAILKTLESKDLTNFKTLVYLPTVIEKVNEMMYTEEDFQDGGKAVSHGDKAIKLLYIPPFALAISILALLLNIVTVFGLLLSTTLLPSKIQFTIKTTLLVIIIILPLTAEHKAFNNTMIQQFTTQETKLYLNFLSWISYYEKVNSSVHLKSKAFSKTNNFFK